VKEPNVTITTDITVATVAAGITHAQDDHLSASLSALYTRAQLDAAQSGGRVLLKTAADSLRVKAEAEAGWTRDNLRPFLTFALRHDSGDGDAGGAVDLGGGVEYWTPAIHVRLAGSGHIQGQGADERRVSLAVRKSAGSFGLGLNLHADSEGLGASDLLSGEWRF